MNATNLQVRRSDSGENGMLVTRESCTIDEGPSLSNLPGELQDLIIINLHPSAAIALSQTNWHFHSCTNLYRLPRSVVFGCFVKGGAIAKERRQIRLLHLPSPRRSIDIQQGADQISTEKR